MPWHFLRKKNATKTRSVWSPGYAQIAKWPSDAAGELPGIPHSPEPPRVDVPAPAPSKDLPQMPKVRGARVDFHGMDFMECFCELILVLGILHNLCFWFVCVEIWQRSPCLCPFSQYNLCTTDWTIWDIEDSRFCVWSQVTVQCPDHPDPFAGIEVGGGR